MQCFASLAQPIRQSLVTDKMPFFADLSVKPGPKCLNFYGQTAVFAHFVRKRQ